MVDNFALIRDFMRFEDPDHFYFLQILQRKKDGPGPMALFQELIISHVL